MILPTDTNRSEQNEWPASGSVPSLKNDGAPPVAAQISAAALPILATQKAPTTDTPAIEIDTLCTVISILFEEQGSPVSRIQAAIKEKCSVATAKQEEILRRELSSLVKKYDLSQKRPSDFADLRRSLQRLFLTFDELSKNLLSLLCENYTDDELQYSDRVLLAQELITAISQRHLHATNKQKKTIEEKLNFLFGEFEKMQQTADNFILFFCRLQELAFCSLDGPKPTLHSSGKPFNQPQQLDPTLKGIAQASQIIDFLYLTILKVFPSGLQHDYGVILSAFMYKFDRQVIHVHPDEQPLTEKARSTRIRLCINALCEILRSIRASNFFEVKRWVGALNRQLIYLDEAEMEDFENKLLVLE